MIELTEEEETYMRARALGKTNAQLARESGIHKNHYKVLYITAKKKLGGISSGDTIRKWYNRKGIWY